MPLFLSCCLSRTEAPISISIQTTATSTQSISETWKLSNLINFS